MEMKGKHGIYTLEAHGSCRSVAFRGTTGAQDVDARRGGKSGPSTYTLWRKVAMMVERGLNTTDEEVKMREG